MFAAVREDRTPGGKHRAKKLRGDELDVSTTGGGGGGGSVVMDWNGCEQDELLLSRLVDTKPDAVNTVDGMSGKHFVCIFPILLCPSYDFVIVFEVPVIMTYNCSDKIRMKLSVAHSFCSCLVTEKYGVLLCGRHHRLADLV